MADPGSAERAGVSAARPPLPSHAPQPAFGDLPAGISEAARDFICRTLSKHQGDRPTARELLHHPWVTHGDGPGQVRGRGGLCEWPQGS